MKVDTVYSSSHSVSRDLLNTSFSTRIMVGKFLSYEAWGMLKFSLPDSLVNVSVTDAKVTLRSSYFFGDSAALSFVPYRATRAWSGDSLTVDSLKQGGYYDPVAVSSQFLGFIGDTDDVEISIDTAMVRSWFGSIPDTMQVNNGIILQPTNTGIIKGFQSFSSLNPEEQRPRLTVQYTKNGIADTVTVSSGTSRYAANIGFTDLVQNPERIYVQAGIAYNGYVNFVSTSPIPSKASIHKAELELVLDQGSSHLNKHTIDSLVAYYVGPSGIEFLITPAVSDTTIISGEKVYRFQIQQYMQRWVRGATAGVALLTYSEVNVIDLFTFYGEKASKQLQPKIIVTYSPTR